jgi:glycine betaine/proline transport system substrate-binding protein
MNMYIFKKFRFIGIVFVLILSLALTACGNSNGNDEGSDNAAGTTSGVDLGKKDITLPYVAWAGVVARTYLAAAVLEDVGYNVDVKQVEAGPAFAGLAGGSADAYLGAWLPVTHKSYWEKYSDKLVKVGKIIDKAPLGLTVPTYMKDVNSIEDLKGNTKLGEATDWTITGIDPGAGEMKATAKALKEYGLDKWKLQTSSEAGMLSALKKAEKNKKPIIVTLWKPHWAFGQWDLKIIKDPKKVYGDADKIYTIARKGLKADSPAAYQVLKQMADNYDPSKEDAMMVNIQKGTSPEDAAKQFLKDNPDLIKKWEKGLK